MNTCRSTQEREQTHPRGLAARGIGKAVWGLKAILLGVVSGLLAGNASALAPVSQPPTVSITSPASGGTMYTSAQTITITASATDNRGVTKVEFYDGGVLKGTDTASPYTWAWAFTSVNNGTHSWTARAYDTDGNTTVSSPVNLTVNITGSAPVATTTAGGNISSTSATANGNVNPKGLATTAYFQYGTTTAYGSTTASQSAGSGTTAVNLSASLSSLSASTTYHYRLVASNSLGTRYGADVTFTTTASSSGSTPVATTTAASSISSSSATANGNANPHGFATTVFFQWGTTTSYGNTTASQSIGSGATAVNVSANLSGLASSTTYHYRLVASNNGGTSFGAEVTFTTAASSGGSAPAAATTSASNINSASATSNGSADPNGLATTGYFQYGTTTGYGNTTASQSAGSGSTPVSISANLGSLSPSTTYHYRAVAYNSMGTSYGADMSFTTAATGGSVPTATTTAANFISSGAATLNGNSNPNGLATTAYFQWGTTTAYGNTTASQSAGSGTAAVNLSQALSGLAASTTYHYRLVASNNKGPSFGADMTFTTASSGGVPTVTTAGASNVGSISATLNGNANPNLLATTTYFQWGTTTSYGSTTASQSIGSGSMSISVSANLAGLTASTTYHYRLVASNSSGTSYGGDMTFTTASAGGGGSGPWVTSIGGTGVDVGYSTATDASGNIIVAGYFSGTVNFGGGALTSAGVQDIFVAKYSPSGAYLWSTRFGGIGDDEAKAVAVDKRNGDVFVTGYFNATATFGNTTYTSTYGQNIFLVKLSASSGAIQWSKAIGGSSALGNSAGYSLAVDPNNGDVALAGVVAGNVNFGAGVTYVSVDSAPFVARYSTTGNYIFARSYYAGMIGNAGRVAVDGGGNVYFGIHAQQSVNFGGGALPHPVGTGNDIYLAKFTALGTFTWSAAYVTTNCELYALAVDPSNNIAMAGRFVGPWNLGGGIVLNSTPTSSAQQSAFVARLSAANGAVSSASAFACTNIVGGSANSAANGLAFDSQGNYTIAGYFQGSGLAGGTRLSAPTISDMEAFAIKYSSANAVVWAKRFGGTGSDVGNSVATDGSANVVIAGSTQGGDFSGVTLPSAGGADIFVLKLAP